MKQPLDSLLLEIFEDSRARSSLVNFIPTKKSDFKRLLTHGSLENTESVKMGKFPTYRLLAGRFSASSEQKPKINSWKLSQMESMFMGHFQNALNPYVVWRAKNEVQFLYTHTIGYSLPSFKQFLITPLSARSILVNLSL